MTTPVSTDAPQNIFDPSVKPPQDLALPFSEGTAEEIVSFGARAGSSAFSIPKEISVFQAALHSAAAALFFPEVPLEASRISDVTREFSVLSARTHINPPEEVCQGLLGAIWSTTCSVAWLGISYIGSLFSKKIIDIPFEDSLKQLLLMNGLCLSQKLSLEEIHARAPQEALLTAASFLGFASDEVVPILHHMESLHGKAPMAALFCLFMIKKLLLCPSLDVINQSEQARLSALSISDSTSLCQLEDNYQLLKQVYAKQHLFSFIQNFPRLLNLQKTVPLKTIQKALKENDIFLFKKTLIQYFFSASQELSKSQNSFLYVKEFKEALHLTNSFESLSTGILQQTFLSITGHKLRVLKSSAKKCLNTAEGSLAIAEGLLSFKKDLTEKRTISIICSFHAKHCLTFVATQEGFLRRSERKIEYIALTAFQRLQSIPMQILRPKELLFLTCSCGGGHNRMLGTLQSALDVHRQHVAFQISRDSLDVPVQVTRSLDPVYAYLGRWNCDTTWLYNYLLSKDHARILAYLKPSGPAKPEVAEARQTLLRRAFLAHGPDMLNMLYTFDGNDVDAVAKQLGIPLLHMATDLDLGGWEILPKSPLFAMAVPSARDRIMASTINPGVPVREIGLAVGPELEQPLGPQRLSELRHRIDEQYHIAPGAKLVVISSGKNAIQNDIPDIIAAKYRSETTKVHLIVVCGTNAKYKAYLESKIIPKIQHKKALSITATGLLSPQQVAELMHVCDTFIGKPGGGTCMDLWKIRSQRKDSGIIFDETAFRFSWEKINARVFAAEGRARILEKSSDVIKFLQFPEVEQPLGRTDEVAEKTASREYIGIVNDLLSRSESHIPQGAEPLRATKRSWYTLTKTFGELYSVAL